jgi:hypothetical protein
MKRAIPLVGFPGRRRFYYQRPFNAMVAEQRAPCRNRCSAPTLGTAAGGDGSLAEPRWRDQGAEGWRSHSGCSRPFDSMKATHHS